jgi:hypothetical protein
MKKLITLIAGMSLLSACSYDQGTFTVISNQIADLDNINLETAQKIRNVEGKSVGEIFILIPVGDMNPNVETAMQDAFTRVDGDIFTNARVSSFAFYFPYIYGRFSQTIEGDVVKTRK